MVIIFYEGVIYACLLAVLCVGLTLTYKITRVPNFAHTSFAVLGMYMALVFTMVFEVNAYVALPAAFLVSGATSLFLYYFIIRIMQKKSQSFISLIIATLSFDILMIGILNIFADYLFNSFRITSRDFTLRSLDVVIAGVPMILLASAAALVGLIFGLYWLLYKTNYGISMRASIENAMLARTFGINTTRIFCTSWFLSGGLAGIAGMLMALWFQGDPSLSFLLLPSVFAGSIVGGFSSIYGAILGGVLVGMSEVVGTSMLANSLGTWIIQYRPIIPFIAMIITLLVLPNGLIQLVSHIRSRAQ